MNSQIEKIVKDSIAVPGSRWRLHPAVPVHLIQRHSEAQRASVLSRLKKTSGKFKKDLAGLPRIVPNADIFYAVTGATRTEYAKESLGNDATLPCEVWPEELSPQKQAEFFLDELHHVEPGIGTRHKIAVVAKKEHAASVQQAIESLPGAEKSVGCFYYVVQRRNGVQLLSKTVEEIVRTWPRAAKHSSPCLPGCLVRGAALLLERGGRIASRWKRHQAEKAQDAARIRKARYGGKGTIAEHAAAILGSRRSA